MDVSLRGVRKTYRGGITALDRLDLDIPPGMLGVLGPGGAGKTTLMRILAVRLAAWTAGRCGQAAGTWPGRATGGSSRSGSVPPAPGIWACTRS